MFDVKDAVGNKLWKAWVYVRAKNCAASPEKIGRSATSADVDSAGLPSWWSHFLSQQIGSRANNYQSSDGIINALSSFGRVKKYFVTRMLTVLCMLRPFGNILILNFCGRHAKDGCHLRRCIYTSTKEEISGFLTVSVPSFYDAKNARKLYLKFWLFSISRLNFEI